MLPNICRSFSFRAFAGKMWSDQELHVHLSIADTQQATFICELGGRKEGSSIAIEHPVALLLDRNILPCSRRSC